MINLVKIKQFQMLVLKTPVNSLLVSLVVKLLPICMLFLFWLLIFLSTPYLTNIWSRIGEISLIKDITESVQMVQEDEEQEDSKTPGEASPSSASKVSTDDISLKTAQLTITDGSEATATASSADSTKPASPNSKTHLNSSAVNKSSDSTLTEAEKNKEKKNKISEKQKEEMKKMIKKREEEREKRVTDLVEKLIKRLTIWTASDKKKEATEFFKAQTTTLAEELKMESFGLELLHAIGYTYYTKGNNFLKSQKLMGVGGMFGKFKEKYTVVKDTWNTISSAIDAQYTIQDMAKYEEESNTLTDLEKAEKEREIMGKILNAAWNGSRFEIQSVLREVCDKVLNDKRVHQKERVERAQGLVIIGDIFRKTLRTKEEQEEVQVFEELVHEAAASKKKKKEKRKQDHQAAAAYAASVEANAAKPESPASESK